MELNVLSSIKTNNFEDPNMPIVIGELWERTTAMLQDYEGAIYGVYDTYMSNYKGDYRLSVAVESSRGGETIRIKDDQKYRVFSVDKEIEQGVYKMWQTIWGLEEAGDLQRAYTVDFERYSPAGEIEIYIALK
ncbi:GyrI-like domain-containing protein [Lysinibacillus sp. 54212]|uniref:GyrI-like domain-containing protein n=1 Tax=Lysinibacillus sp. 54212 TaxID=3119829 RepID=UPI002FC8BBA7